MTHGSKAPQTAPELPIRRTRAKSAKLQNKLPAQIQIRRSQALKTSKLPNNFRSGGHHLPASAPVRDPNVTVHLLHSPSPPGGACPELSLP